MKWRRLVCAVGAWSLALAALLPACNDNMLTGTLTPVPPVHRVPPDLDGHTVLIAEDPLIESRDPVHLARAKEMRVPQDYREAMERALKLAGFRVVSSRDVPYDLEAKLALHVDEDTGKVRQVYRCNLRTPDGASVAQVDWSWPQGTYVYSADVYEFAAHHLANEVAMARPVLAFFRGPRQAPAPAAAPAASSAAAAPAASPAPSSPAAPAPSASPAPAPSAAP